MKFCKNLQQVIDISDPAWEPYWMNYKLLKKLIKDLALSGESSSVVVPQTPAVALSTEAVTIPSVSTTSRIDTVTNALELEKRTTKRVSWKQPPDPQVPAQQNHGDATSERGEGCTEKSPSRPRLEGSCSSGEQHVPQSTKEAPPTPKASALHSSIAKNPGEVAFFKYLHAELKKSEYFFQQTTEEFQIRVERAKQGLNILREQQKQQQKFYSDVVAAAPLMMQDKWLAISKAMYQLYKDLLLLETYAIITYVGFSKILKKHDKMTGLSTCTAFMENIVNKANFTHYPRLMIMIQRCERLYEGVSKLLERTGKKALSEDERLFVHMIQRLNAHVLETDKLNGYISRQPTASSSAFANRLIGVPKSTGPEESAMVTRIKATTEKIRDMQELQQEQQRQQRIAPEVVTANNLSSLQRRRQHDRLNSDNDNTGSHSDHSDSSSSSEEGTTICAKPTKRRRYQLPLC